MTISDCDQKYLKVLEKYIISQFKVPELKGLSWKYLDVRITQPDKSDTNSRRITFRFMLESFEIKIHMANKYANIIAEVYDMNGLLVSGHLIIQDAISYTLFELAIKHKELDK